MGEDKLPWNGGEGGVRILYRGDLGVVVMLVCRPHFVAEYQVFPCDKSLHAR